MIHVTRHLGRALTNVYAAIDRDCAGMSAMLTRAWDCERERVAREFAFLARSMAQQARRARERRP
jgi:hypothetical protein